MDREKSIIMAGMIVIGILACVGLSQKEGTKEIINNKAEVLNITSCSTYDIGCKRLAEINNNRKIIKDKAFKVDENIFAISVDEYMVQINFDETVNKLLYVGVKGSLGLSDIEKSSYSVFNAYIPNHLKEEIKENNSSVETKDEFSGEVIVIDGYEKTSKEWENLKDKYKSNGKGAINTDEDIKEREALMKYEEQINNQAEVVITNKEVIIE